MGFEGQIERTSDIEHLREIARTLHFENDRLHRRLRELTKELARSSGQDAANLQLEIQLLQEQLDARNRKLFGRSSEKSPKETNGNGAKEESSASRRGHGPKAQAELAVVETVHTLDEADQTCPKCGGGLSEWPGQYEESDEVDVVERSFRIVRRKRQKYRCECGECVETALGPKKLIPGGRYSVDFAIEVATGKYADHLPLARQVKQMAREGLEVDTQTLWDQIEALARHLGPTWKRLHDYVLEAPVIGADETTWRLMGETNGGKTWWAWSVSRPDAVCYRIFPSRSAEAAGKILRDFRGTVVADGYSAYRALRQQSRDGPRFELASCWAHARRKFVDAEADYPEAREVIERIGKLYEIERRGREDDVQDRETYIAELRKNESAPIVREIRDWLLERKTLPKSSLGKAIAYTFEIWTGLTRFLDDPRIPIDNNQTERGMRGVAIGRKNHYGSRSKRGTEVAALFYSLIETAKMSGIEPRAYLREATRRALDHPGTATLPYNLVDSAATLGN